MYFSDSLCDSVAAGLCSCVVVWVENLAAFQPTRLLNQAEGELLIITVTPLRGMLYTLHLYPSSRSVTVCSLPPLSPFMGVSLTE